MSKTHIKNFKNKRRTSQHSIKNAIKKNSLLFLAANQDLKNSYKKSP